MSETETGTSALAVDPAAAPAADPAAVDPPQPDQTPEPTPETVQHGNKGKKPWFLDRISEETAAKNAERERAIAAERRAQSAEALLQRLQANPDGNTPSPVQTPATPAIDEAQIEQLVDKRAEARLFAQDTVNVKNAGLAKFGAGFETTLGILTDLGVTKDDIVSDILAVDKANAHILLDTLAADPEKASTLVRMSPKARIAELTRMSMTTTAPAAKTTPAPAAPAPKTVSRAPAPPPPVEPSASKVTDWRTSESDADFSKGWEENMAKRAARR